MFIEKEWDKYWKRILLFLFVILTLPSIWLPELSEDEAFHSLIAQEMVRDKDFLIPRYQGASTTMPPVISWQLTGLYSLIPVNEFTSRLPGVIALGGMSILCGVIAFKSAGVRAGAVAAAAALSSAAALINVQKAGGDMFFALLICCGWLLWYTLSREKRQWLFAWFSSHLVIFLAFLTGGVKAIFFFYFPLIWLRRPLKVGLRLRQADHILSLTAFISLILIWIFLAPFQKEGLLSFFREFKHHEPATSYFAHLLTFPLLSVISYFPWSFLVWPAFCMAFIPLEKDPVLCQFLRTIIFSIFFCFWLTPETEPQMLIPLIGPLSILTGIHYEILVRRYGKQLLLLPKFISWLSIMEIILALSVAAFFYANVFKAPHYIIVSCAIFLSLSAACAVLAIRGVFNAQVWLAVVVSVATFQLAYSYTIEVGKHELLHDRRVAGETLSSNIPKDVTVYTLIPGNEPLPVESYYLRHPLISVSNTGEIPAHEQLVYLLGPDKTPISRTRDWTALTQPVEVRSLTLRVWKGQRR